VFGKGLSTIGWRFFKNVAHAQDKQVAMDDINTSADDPVV